MNKMNGHIVIIKTNYCFRPGKVEELRDKLFKQAEEGLIIVDVPESEIHVIPQKNSDITFQLVNGEDYTYVGNKR